MCTITYKIICNSTYFYVCHYIVLKKIINKFYLIELAEKLHISPYPTNVVYFAGVTDNNTYSVSIEIPKNGNILMEFLCFFVKFAT